MRQGNNGNSVQTAGTAVISDVQNEARVCSENGYSANTELILLARSDDDSVASAAMNELVLLNRGLVKNIALRFRDRGVELEDLIQIGTIGMIKAVRGFDIERGTNFSTYAFPLIFGEIRRYLRDEGPIKVGRYYKKLGAQLLNEKNRIFSEEGRDARLSELAQLCGVSAEEAAMALDAVSPIASLSDSAYGDDDSMELGDTIMDAEASYEMERIADRVALGQALSHMPEQWQRIVGLRFYRNMTQQQTADVLGITQVKVSREEKKLLEFLRKELS